MEGTVSSVGKVRGAFKVNCKIIEVIRKNFKKIKANRIKSCIIRHVMKQYFNKIK